MNNADRASAQEIVEAALNRAGPDIVITHEGCFSEIFHEASRHFPTLFRPFSTIRRNRSCPALIRIIKRMRVTGDIERFSPTHFRASTVLLGCSGTRTYNHLPPEDQAAVLWVAERIRQTFSTDK